MKNTIIQLMAVLCIATSVNAQINVDKFGKGISFLGQDSTFQMKLNFRFQNLMIHDWDVVDGSLENHASNFLIRRSRIKMGGWAVDPSITFKFEMGLSNRDIGGGSSEEFNDSPRLILDAVIAWNFYKNFTIQFGQTKLPGNRERVISSANLQFVDRSRLNSRYNIDRDVGFQLKHDFTIGEKFLVREVVAISQGEGRNVTVGNFNGSDYTFRLEALPFGGFKSKGDYVGSAIVLEKTPKLAIGLTYDINNNAVRERGQNGSFIESQGRFYGKTINTFFADMMFKHKRTSVMVEYVDKQTDDGSPFVYVGDGAPIGTFYTGTGINAQIGYMFDKNWEIAGRYTSINPDEGVARDETQYTLGISKFIAGHNLKVQTDFTYRAVDNSNNSVFWRTQVEFQF